MPKKKLLTPENILTHPHTQKINSVYEYRKFVGEFFAGQSFLHESVVRFCAMYYEVSPEVSLLLFLCRVFLSYFDRFCRGFLDMVVEKKLVVAGEC